MPYEDYEIRISKDGTVYLYVDGITEERVRSIQDFLEEQIGPIKSLEVVRRPDWDLPAHRAASESAETTDELKLNRDR